MQYVKEFLPKGSLQSIYKNISHMGKHKKHIIGQDDKM